MIDKFISPCPAPEGLDRELLTLLSEECAEVIQRVTKALRFGLDEVQPGQHLTNAERILQEFADVQAVFAALEAKGLFESIAVERIEKWKCLKTAKIEAFLQSGSILEDPACPNTEE